MPNPRPLLTLGLVLTLAAASLAQLEGFWRARGHRSYVVDDADLWCQQRRRIEGADEVVLMGASRILLGASLERLRDRLPSYEPVQLAVGAHFPLATLRNLAGDESFRGIVIASVIAQAFEPEFREGQEDWVQSCRRGWNLERRVGRAAKTPLEERFATIAPRVSFREVGRTLVASGRLPTPWWVVRARDRSGFVDFAFQEASLGRKPPIVHARYDGLRISSPAHWLEHTARVESWIGEIEARGGRVAVVRYPTSGGQWQLDEEAYPRAFYWDAFAARTRAVTLHFLDDPRLTVSLPDESHLAPRDIPPFTDALIDALMQRGLFLRP